jgi:RNA-directed DNA polymerase
VVNGTIAITHKTLQTAMDKVKALTPSGAHKTLEPTLGKLNQWYVG